LVVYSKNYTQFGKYGELDESSTGSD